MDIFGKILRTIEKDGVADLEAKIGELDRDETAARAELQAIDGRRREFLFANDDIALDADQVAAEKARRVIEKAALVRPNLLAALSDARVKARNEAIRKLRREQSEVIVNLRTAMLAAVEANEMAVKFHERIRATLGEQTAAVEFPPVAYSLLSRQMLEPWQAHIDQFDGSSRSRPVAPDTSSLPSLTAPKPKAINLDHAAVGGSQRTKRSPRKPLPETTPPGHIRCIVLRNGYQAPDGEGLLTGDQVDLPNSVAETAMKNGAVDHISMPSAPLSEL